MVRTGAAALALLLAPAWSHRVTLQVADESGPQLKRKKGRGFTHDAGPGAGECATYAVDNYAPPADGKCFVRLYKCAEKAEYFSIKNANLGDITWALTEKCRSYGNYLHVWKVEVAQASMIHGEHKYQQCNRNADYGLLCGCGLKVDHPEQFQKKCPLPEPWTYG